MSKSVSSDPAIAGRTTKKPPCLRVVHILRAPVGGLFRHVCDLAAYQANAGFEVGVIADARAGDALTDNRLTALQSHCAIGLYRVPMPRLPGPSDVAALARVKSILAGARADVVHGHGAKGGAYARMAPRSGGCKSFYTPHGGVLHYSRWSPAGFLFLTLERLLSGVTDGLIFESAYSKDIWHRKIAPVAGNSRVIPNGVSQADFEPVSPNGNGYDFVFVGELRRLKGIDVLLNAIGRLRDKRPVRALIVGTGRDEADLQAQAGALNLTGLADFSPPMPARKAFALGACVVVPSRKESFPYIVLEAAAAARPLIATGVGGIPEIFGKYSDRLIGADDAAGLADAMENFLDAPDAATLQARQLQKHVARAFSVERMGGDIAAYYLDAAARKAASVDMNAKISLPVS